MITGILNSMGEKKDIETIKRNQSEIKNALSEINTLEGIKSRVDAVEDQISD